MPERRAYDVALHRRRGIGIAKDAQASLFNRFSQADTATAAHYGGTGLGLAISKQLIEQMDGEIALESALGKGTSITFTARFGAVSSATDERTADMSSLKLLVVDDTELNRIIYRKQLAGWGMTVVLAANGEEAMAALKEAEQANAPFDIAILDYMMPGMNGVELATRIRQHSAFDDTKLILASAIGNRNTREIAGDIDFVAHLRNPVRRSVLFDAIAESCDIYQEDAEDRENTDKKPLSLDHRPTDSVDGAAEGAGGKSLRILVAEDNSVNQLLAVRTLEKAGHRADVAHNGIEAVRAVRDLPYDLVLMDVNMPEMGGLEATAQIRAMDGIKKNIPIIALTAEAMVGDRERLLAAGMNDYVSKPLDRRELINVVERWRPDADSDQTPTPEPHTTRGQYG